MMKKAMLPIVLSLVLILLGACSGQPEQNKEEPSATQSAATEPAATEPADSGTVVYESENGPIEIPSNPQRIVGLSSAPNILSLNGTLVGVDEWTKSNPLFADRLEGVQTVSDESLEEILALEPDLIIAGSTNKNLDKLSEIAPTIVYTWGKLDYLQQQIEIGKVLNKEEEAKAWVDDFKSRAKAAGDEIKAKAGENVTVSVFETDSKNFYVFGNNWARGTEVLYQAMGLQMTDKVKKDALGPGYYTLSLEVLPEYAGDFIVLSRGKQSDNAFMKSKTWESIPAVKNGRVIEIATEASTYSDPITLDYLLNIFKEQMLAKS